VASDLCGLCGANPADRREVRVGELALCAPCHRAEFGARLGARGIAYRERRWIRYYDGGVRRCYYVELAGGVPFDLGLRLELTPEGPFSGLGKLFSRELRTGDGIFDDAVKVETDTPDVAAAALAISGARDAIIDILSNTHTLHVSGNVAWVLEFGSLANKLPDTRALARTLAALLHHLRATAIERGCTPCAVDFSGLEGSAYPAEPGHAWDR
jgi:hypothetical protein